MHQDGCTTCICSCKGLPRGGRRGRTARQSMEFSLWEPYSRHEQCGGWARQGGSTKILQVPIL